MIPVSSHFPLQKIKQKCSDYARILLLHGNFKTKKFFFFSFSMSTITSYANIQQQLLTQVHLHTLATSSNILQKNRATRDSDCLDALRQQIHATTQHKTVTFNTN